MGLVESLRPNRGRRKAGSCVREIILLWQVFRAQEQEQELVPEC